MIFFGHLGIGLKLASPFSRKLPTRVLLLGTILPDLIDKTLYYGLSWTTGKRGADLGIIAGTRNFGHTALFLIGLTLLALLRKSKALAALSLGVATHLLLDNIGDRIVDPSTDSLRALFWPLEGWQFPVYPYSGLADHLSKAHQPFFFWAEIAGAALLFWEYWKVRHQHEIKKLPKFSFSRLRRKRG